MAESWEDAEEFFHEMEECEPEVMRRLALEEEARYRKELEYFREKQRRQIRRADEEKEEIRLAQGDSSHAVDEFEFIAVDVQEVDEVVGGGQGVVKEQGEAPPKQSRNQKRRERKKQAEMEEKRELEEGKTMEEELASGKAKRKAQEEDRVAGKMARSGLTARWEAKLEAMETRMKRQREEDVKAWGLKVANLGAIIAEQQKDLEALRKEVSTCYHRMPSCGRGARAGSATGGRPADPRRAVPRAGTSLGSRHSRGSLAGVLRTSQAQKSSR